jgi:hypothetical protein
MVCSDMSIKGIVLVLPVVGLIAFAASAPADNGGTDQVAVQAGLAEASTPAMVGDGSSADPAGDTANPSDPVVEPYDAGDDLD